MSNIDNHRAAHEAWNRRDFAAQAAVLADDVAYIDHPGGATLKSPAEFQAWAAAWYTAFSDGEISGPTYIAAGDVTICQFHGRGTNDGPFGALPPTGRRLDLPFCEVMHWNSDGKVDRGEAYYDMQTVLAQLGHAQPPA